MVDKTSIAWKIALAFLLGAAVVFAAPVMGAPAWAQDNPVAGLKEAKVAAKLKQLHSAPGIERMDQCSIAMRGQKVDKAQVSPDVTIVENGWITLVGYQAKGYAYIAP